MSTSTCLFSGSSRALIDFGIGITKFDGNVSLELIFESNRLDARNGLDDGTLAVSDMTDRTHINSSLS
jgi:hypothetical protein